MSNNHTSDQPEPSLAICLHFNDSEIKHIGPKQRMERVCLSLPITVESVHLYVYLYVWEINCLRNITYPTAPVTYTYTLVRCRRKYVQRFFFPHQHLLHTLHFNWFWSSSELRFFFFQELWKQLASLTYQFFKFIFLKKNEGQHINITIGSKIFFKLSALWLIICQ